MLGRGFYDLVPPGLLGRADISSCESSFDKAAVFVELDVRNLDSRHTPVLSVTGRALVSGRENPMKTVKDLLRAKGYDVWSITPDATVFDALTTMAHKDVGALTVMEKDQLVGIISERDYARKVILQGKTSRATLVREIMSSPVICVRPQQTVEECMALLTGRRIRHLPVIDENQVVGMISIGDLVKSIISEQQFVIEQLENYIIGIGARYP